MTSPERMEEILRESEPEHLRGTQPPPVRGTESTIVQPRPPVFHSTAPMGKKARAGNPLAARMITVNEDGELDAETVVVLTQ